MNSTVSPARVCVIDDHTLFRRGLIALLTQDERLMVVGEGSDVGEALRCVQAHQPDLVLLDNHMPGVRGIDGIDAIKQMSSAVRIVMLTVSESEDDLVAALRAGADGYLLKTSDADELTQSIQRVLTGESVVSAEMTGKLVAALRQAHALGSTEKAGETASEAVKGRSADLKAADDLSLRERQILRLIAQGDSNKVIARTLDIAETTVKIHVQHVLKKLKLTSRVQIAVYAVNNGLDT